MAVVRTGMAAAHEGGPPGVHVRMSAFAVALCGLVLPCGAGVEKPGAPCGLSTWSIQQHNPNYMSLTREYVLLAPEELCGPDMAGQTVPLVVAFHSLGGCPETILKEFERAAGAHGFVVVAPRGYSGRPGTDQSYASWNAGVCCSPAVDLNLDDISFARGVIARLLQEQPLKANFGLHLSPEAVYLMGYSNGGFFAPLLAEAEPLVRGVAVLAGHPYNTSKLSRPIMISIHWMRQDTNVLYDGCCGASPCCCNISSRWSGKCVPATSMFQRWLEINECTGVELEQQGPLDGSRPDKKRVSCRVGKGCSRPVRLCSYEEPSFHGAWEVKFVDAGAVFENFAADVCSVHGIWRHGCDCSAGYGGPLCLSALSAEASSTAPSPSGGPGPPGAGWPGNTAELSNAAWKSGSQPKSLEEWPKLADNATIAPCWKMKVVEDSLAGWSAACIDLKKYQQADGMEQCASSCYQDPFCASWKYTSGSDSCCWHGLGSQCDSATAGSTDALVGAQTDALLGAQRIQHGEVRVLKDMEGWEVKNLRFEEVGHDADKATLVKRCKMQCYLDVTCQYWLYSEGRGCYVEEHALGAVPYPLIKGTDALRDSKFARSVIAGEYIQHFCPLVSARSRFTETTDDGVHHHGWSAGDMCAAVLSFLLVLVVALIVVIVVLVRLERQPEWLRSVPGGDQMWQALHVGRCSDCKNDCDQLVGDSSNEMVATMLVPSYPKANTISVVTRAPPRQSYIGGLTSPIMSRTSSSAHVETVYAPTPTVPVTVSRQTR
eukprot:gnl/TRDRNA2_/TRDRNA2_135321_c0_seq1.p1 gnl/TRDRNA2_/TRDRNA2_135321_c0~~gnl/TRDRNA2_/TRDRNA2_135321_c0_seq1.p1  ORF type:complete len:772 (-),score=98.56 gnl/TRDRNA2_/TRDRNA2_135321_c0_seq1:90-2405(-)